MKYSFKLRNPKIDEPTPIYFTVFFKEENNSTIKRYEYFKNNLMEFQTQSNRKITFESINQSFYNDFLKFSVATKK